MSFILTADYHTHTPYSHGKNTVAQNTAAAKEKGLKQIGITDHGFGHLAFGLRHKKVLALLAECKQASAEYGIDVLVGTESNIRGESGLTDFTEKDYENFDLFLCGKHVLISYETFPDWWHYFLGNLMTEKFRLTPSSSLIRRNTKAYIHAIERNPIDAITHLKHKCPADALEVAKCAADYGTYIELNAAKQHLSDEELSEIVAKTQVRFLINSDAHRAMRVGNFAVAAAQVERVGVPLERIDNINGRLPSFRFSEYKKHRGIGDK